MATATNIKRKLKAWVYLMRLAVTYNQYVSKQEIDPMISIMFVGDSGTGKSTTLRRLSGNGIVTADMFTGKGFGAITRTAKESDASTVLISDFGVIINGRPEVARNVIKSMSGALSDGLHGCYEGPNQNQYVDYGGVKVGVITAITIEDFTRHYAGLLKYNGLINRFITVPYNVTRDEQRYLRQVKNRGDKRFVSTVKIAKRPKTAIKIPKQYNTVSDELVDLCPDEFLEDESRRSNTFESLMRADALLRKRSEVDEIAVINVTNLVISLWGVSYPDPQAKKVERTQRHARARNNAESDGTFRRARRGPKPKPQED